jgi:hypothetical protein
MPELIDPFAGTTPSELFKDEPKEEVLEVDEAGKVHEVPVEFTKTVGDLEEVKAVLKSKYELEYEEAHSKAEEVRDNRPEGEIPLNDPYWPARDRLTLAHKNLENSRVKPHKLTVKAE